MSIDLQEIPKVAQQRIETIMNKLGMTEEEVMEKYETVFNLDFIVAAPTPEFRHIWASAKLHADFFSRPPVKGINIVPVGIEGINKFGEADPHQNIFALNYDTDKLISIRADKKALPLVEEMTIGEYYGDMNLSASEQNPSNFFMDDRAELPEPAAYLGAGEEYPENIDDLLTRVLKVREIIMSDFGNPKLISKRAPSSSDGTKSYVNSLDWVCIRNCMVISNRKFAVKGMDGKSKGMLQVTDNTVVEDITMANGTIIPNRMSVWVAERHILPAYSICHLWGTVEHRKWKQKDPNDSSKMIERQNFQMNAHYVFPVAVGPAEESN